MNTEITIHPKLHHLGLTTGNLEAMIDWYRKVLGMTVVHQTEAAAGGQKDAPTLKAAWVSNDEANHRLAFVQLPGLTADPDRSRHHRLQHVAFEYRTIDELLGTYARLKGLGIVPVLSTDGGSQTAFYYEDPDRNSVESTSTITAIAGLRASTCERHRISPETRWAPMSIRTR